METPQITAQQLLRSMADDLDALSLIEDSVERVRGLERLIDTNRMISEGLGRARALRVKEIVDRDGATWASVQLNLSRGRIYAIVENAKQV